MQRTCSAFLAVAACAAVVLPVWAVNRCVLADGRVTYQDALCPATAGASQVRLFTPPSDPAGRQRAAADVAAAAKLARAAEVVPAEAVGLNQARPAQGQGSLAGLAGDCLNTIRPSLRDPAGAYWTGASIDRLDVLRMTLHATNGYGGYVTKDVSCEVRKGQVAGGRN